MFIRFIHFSCRFFVSKRQENGRRNHRDMTKMSSEETTVTTTELDMMPSTKMRGRKSGLSCVQVVLQEKKRRRISSFWRWCCIDCKIRRKKFVFLSLLFSWDVVMHALCYIFCLSSHAKRHLESATTVATLIRVSGQKFVVFLSSIILFFFCCFLSDNVLAIYFWFLIIQGRDQLRKREPTIEKQWRETLLRDVCWLFS